MTTVPQQQAAPEPSSTQAAESVDNAQATASKAKDSIWNRAVKKMADTVGKGKEMPTGTVTDVLKRLTTEKALKEDNQDPAQTQRHLSQLQTLEFINTIFRKKKSAETEAESPDGEKKTAFNDTDKSGERDGSWKDRIKASMRRGFKGEMPKEAEVKYKSDKNVIDLMAEKAKEVMDKLKGNAESVKEGLEDAAEDLLDNDGPDGRKKGKGKVKSNKPLSKKDRLRKGIRSVLDKTRAVDKGYRRLVGKAVRKGASLGARAYGTVYKAGGNALWNVGKSAVLGGLEGAGGLIMKGVTAARGMAMAGSAIGAAGGVGGLLAAAGSMMLTPVGLIAGVGALGYGAYKAFKWWNRNKASVYTNLRLRQYGLTESDSDNNHFIFELEEYLMKEAVGYQHEGTPYLMEKKLDPEKVLEIFDIDAEDEERMEGFMTWFNGRFKPVFLSHLAALFKVDRKANLHDIDDIKPEALVQYINTIATSNGPYDITASPFEDPEELSAGPNDVEAAIDLAKLELSKISKNLKGKEALPGVAAVSQTTQALDKKTEAEHTARPSTSIGKAVEATKPESKGIVQNILGKIPSLLLEAGTAVSDMFDDAKKLMTKFSKNLIHKFAGFATALEAVRFKTYGLVTIDIHKAGIFRKLEKGLFKYLTVDKDVKASFEGDVTEILKEYGSDFGVTGIEHENAPTWIRWFRLRFLPAYLDYIGAATQALGKREPDEIEDILKENDKYNIALKLSGLSDVWRVEEAPWPNTKSGLDPKVCDENLNYLQARVKEEQIKEEKAKKPADSQTNAGIKPPEQKPYSMTEDARRTNENLQQRTDGENPSILKQQTNDGGPDTETKQTLGNLHVTMDQGPMASGLGGDAFLNVAPGVDVGHIHPGLLQNLKAMAEDYGTQTGKKLHITSGFRSREKQEMLHRKDPKMTAAPGHSLHEFGLALDASSKDLNELESLGLMRKYGFTRPVGGEDWHMEPAGIQTNIQKAKDDFNFAEKMIQASIGHGGGGYGTVGNAAKARRNSQLALSLLGDINTTPPDMVATAEKMKDLRANPTNAAPPMEGAQSGGYGDQGGQATGYTGGVGGGQAAGGGYGGMTPVGYGGGSQGGGLTLQTKSFGAMGGGGYAGSVASSGSSATSGGGQGWMNQTATGQDGEKPSASQPPLKTTPPGKQEILKIIEEGSKEVGVDPQTMKVFAAQESSLNPNAGARNTSAKGLFQFLSSTWQEQLRKFDKKYDELAAGSSPYDPKASTILAGEYLKQNFNQIKNLVPKLGPVEAYMTHLLGGGGAKRFFSTPPETPAAAVLPKAAGSNRSLFFAGGSPLSISGVYENIKNMLAKKAASFGIPMPDSTNVGQGSAPPDAVAGADDPSKGLSMTVEKKPSDQIAGYINGKAVPSQAAGSAATPSEPLTSPAASTTTATNESNQGSGQGTQVSTPPAAKKDDGMTRVDLSRKLTDNPPEPSTPPPTPLTASESSPTQQLGQAPAGYSASVSTPTQQYASQATALNPNTTANAALPGLVPMQDKRDLIAPAAMVMQANAPLVPSFNMATLGDGINSVGDTLKSSLKIQQETLDVLKTLASSLSPEQMQSLLKGLAPTPAPDTAPAPSSPSAPMTSAKRDIPASAINLNRTMA
jgi:LAS superfamily LD-carboxypeptidase LdcB